MRRLLIGLVVGVSVAVLPALALAGNQEVAEAVAQGMKQSDQLADLNNVAINVKVQDGTVWLSGHVATREQMNAALRVAYQTSGVVRVVNQIELPDAKAEDKPQAGTRSSDSASNPLRGSQAKSATRIPNSFSSTMSRKVSAEESLAEPQEVSPQRARPMLVASRDMQVAMQQQAAAEGGPMPMYAPTAAAGAAPVRYDQPRMPNYAWPSYAAYPNYAAVTYPKQYSPMAWPYIGPFYPYPQVPLGWRKVTLQWSDGWWFLDFKDQPASCWQR